MTPPYAPTNTNLSGCWGKPIIPIFKFIPEGDTITYILYLISYIFFQSAFADGQHKVFYYYIHARWKRQGKKFRFT